MSSILKETISCPKCGKSITFTRWQSINDFEPSAMEDIISGKLFNIQCNNCGQGIHMNYPILVNDMQHNVMIHYTFPEEKDVTEEVVRSQKKWYKGKLRIVTDQDDLREKVAIFNAGFDDRGIEILKEDYMNQVKDQLSGKKVLSVRFAVDDTPRFIIDYDQGSGYIPINMEDYEYWEQYYFGVDDILDPAEVNNEVYVDRNWAQSLLAEMY